MVKDEKCNPRRFLLIALRFLAVVGIVESKILESPVYCVKVVHLITAGLYSTKVMVFPPYDVHSQISEQIDQCWTQHAGDLGLEEDLPELCDGGLTFQECFKRLRHIRLSQSPFRWGWSYGRTPSDGTVQAATSRKPC